MIARSPRPRRGDPRMAKEILIADPDKADQEEFQKIFGTTGYHLIFSETGEDALLRAKLFKPDMIIASGAGLHEMDGLELCGAIKGDPEFRHVPFILISNIFDEISEKDRQRSQADGVISKPLNENEVLDLLDHLVEEEAVGKRKKMVSEKQDDLLFGATGEGEDEIIELVDVVDEPEPKMSIDSFVPSDKGKSFEEMTSLDSWEKLEFEEKPEEKKIPSPPKRETRDIDLRFKKQRSFEGAPSEKEFFEKIELEEILEKVEQLKPSLEKEWPTEKEATYAKEKPSEMAEAPKRYLDLPEFEATSEKEVTYFEEKPAKAEEPPERYLDLPEFEATSEKEVTYFEEKPAKAEEPVEKYLDLPEFEPTPQKEIKAGMLEEELAPLSIEEPEKRVSEEAIRTEEFAEEEELQPFFVEEPKEEIPEEAIPIAESAKAEKLEGLPKETVMEEQELEELLEEEFPEELLEEILGEERVDVIGKPKEARLEEVKIEEIQPEAIRTETLEEFEASRTYKEEIKPLVSEMRKQMQEATPMVKVLDKDLEEVIAKGIQDMVGDFITKILPLMTQHIIGLTTERIERMVREIVPDLAEKAIQEEIKRLQKGEKEQ
jgi:CheY-like chemotaxis protein